MKLLLDECTPKRLKLDFSGHAVQQHLPNFPIAIVILTARSNRYSELRVLVPKVEEALPGIKPGDVVRVR